MVSTPSAPTYEPTGKTGSALFNGTCPGCNKPLRAGAPIVQVVIRYATGAASSPTFVHAACPTSTPKPAAASAGLKRAKYASRCPGCGSLIEAGAALYFDPDLGRYVSDCCV